MDDFENVIYENILCGSDEELYTKRRLPLKLMRINGIIVPVVCNVEDAQIYALIERKEK